MIQITEEFIKELEAYKMINHYRNMGFTIKEISRENAGGSQSEEIPNENKFELHLEELTEGKRYCFRMRSCEIRNIELKNYENMKKCYLERIGLKSDDDVEGTESDRLLSSSVRAELYWRAMYDTYITIAEKIIKQIKNCFHGIEGRIVIYSNADPPMICDAGNLLTEKIKTHQFDHAIAKYHWIKTMLTYRCPEREDVAINAYDQLAGTQVWSPNEDLLSNLTLLGKLLLLQKKVMRDVALNNISHADGITDVTYNEKRYTWDYTGDQL